MLVILMVQKHVPLRVTLPPAFKALENVARENYVVVWYEVFRELFSCSYQHYVNVELPGERGLLDVIEVLRFRVKALQFLECI